MRFENFERSTQIIGGALRVPRILDEQINQLLKAQTCRSPPVYILYGHYLISGRLYNSNQSMLNIQVLHIIKLEK